MNRLTLRKANQESREVVLAILDEAAWWLQIRGIQQWPSPFPRSVVDYDLEYNSVWLALLGESTVGTASILKTDPMFWGDVGGDSWYLHRFAIRRQVAGAGREILGLIEGEACLAGATSVRLDCGVGLQSYYEGWGYELRSSVSLVSATSSPPRSQWFCYEKLLPASIERESLRR
jgi:hypothetical protein